MVLHTLKAGVSLNLVVRQKVSHIASASESLTSGSALECCKSSAKLPIFNQRDHFR